MKLLFVVNPISGGVDKEPFLTQAKTLCNRYGITYKIFKTTGENDREKFQQQLKSFHPDRVISVGGDGTTLFTATCLLHTNYPMGIIPLGSANGMATELFVNPDPIEALKDIIMSNVIEGLDMIVVNDEHYSIHMGDVGVNAKIVESYSKDDSRGLGTYAKYFFEQLQKLKPFGMTITANGKTYEKAGLMVAICNSRKYGTGIPLNFVGNPMDGKFEIVIVERIDVLSLIKAGLSKFDEEFIDNQTSSLLGATEAQISFNKPRLLQLDGEVIGKFKELDIKIIKGAVKLITHEDNLYIQS